MRNRIACCLSLASSCSAAAAVAVAVAPGADGGCAAAPVPVAITNVRLIRHVESSVAQGAKVSTLLVLRSYIANKSDNTVDQIFDNCLKTWILNTFVETLNSRPYENFLANFCTSALKKGGATAFLD